MFNNLNNNIISKSQLCEEIARNSVSEDIFAKTVSYSGIEKKFHIDIPEILTYEQNLQERTDDIKKFTTLAMSDIDNDSHNDMVRGLYLQDGFIGSEWETEIFSELSVNDKLLNDLFE